MSVPDLRPTLAGGQQIYRIDDDGRPSLAGHEAIEAAVLSELQNLKFVH